ncbi:MAG: hypothetical protein Q4F67_13205, partial [Propionibacteriaceae bacterium]|nr:hypothetical protein [Propionibacteriaceae bacterium]
FGDPARMPYAFDVALVQSADAESWAGVGAVRVEEGYHTAEQASATVTNCLAQAYAGFTMDIGEAAAIEIPGAGEAFQRWGRLSQEGIARDFRVIVADTASPESLAVYVRITVPESAEAVTLSDAEAGLAGR